MSLSTFFFFPSLFFLSFFSPPYIVIPFSVFWELLVHEIDLPFGKRNHHFVTSSDLKHEHFDDPISLWLGICNIVRSNSKQTQRLDLCIIIKVVVVMQYLEDMLVCFFVFFFFKDGFSFPFLTANFVKV